MLNFYVNTVLIQHILKEYNTQSTLFENRLLSTCLFILIH